MIQDKLLTADEVAPLFHVSRKTVLQWARDGFLNSKRFKNRRILFLESDIAMLMQSGISTTPTNVNFTKQRIETGTKKGSWE